MKNNTKNTKKIHNKGGTASKKPKSPGKTVKKPPKQKRGIQSSIKRKDDANKIAIFNRHRTDDVNVLPYADNSLLRALTRYSSEDVEHLSATDIESIYQKWRKIESETRKGHRERKRNEGKGSTRGAQKQTVQHDDADLRNYAAAAVEEIEAVEALQNMNKYGSNEFSVPGSPTPYTVVDYPSGFTPHDRKRKSKKIDTSNPQDLFNELNHEIDDDDFLPDLNEDEKL